MDVIPPVIHAGVKPIYLDSKGQVFCVVDNDDYAFAMEWKWKIAKSKGKATKLYAFRTTRDQGRHVGIYLHKLICLRRHGLPPSIDYTVADHSDGNSLNNSGSNLAWATPNDNRRNRHGVNAIQMRLAIKTGEIERVLKVPKVK